MEITPVSKPFMQKTGKPGVAGLTKTEAVKNLSG